MEDKNIVIGLKNRDENSFNAFYYKYKNLIYFVINNLLYNDEESKDLLQETLIDVYEKISMFQEGTNFKAWVLRIAKNKAYDYYRKHKYVVDEKLISNLKSDTKNNNLLFDDLRKVLDENEFQVLVLHAAYDLKIDDIASYLDLGYEQVKYLYKLAKNKAKKFLKEV